MVTPFSRHAPGRRLGGARSSVHPASSPRSAFRGRPHLRVDPSLDPWPSSSARPPGIARALAVVSAPCTEVITLEEAAGIAGLSKFHFCRVFKHATGGSFRGDLRQLRIAQAKALLAATPLTVTGTVHAARRGPRDPWSRLPAQPQPGG